MLKRIQTIIVAGVLLGASLLPNIQARAAHTSIAALLRIGDGTHGCLPQSYDIYHAVYVLKVVTSRVRAEAGTVLRACDLDGTVMDNAISCGKPACYGLPADFKDWALARDYARDGYRAEMDTGVIFAALAIQVTPPDAVVVEWWDKISRWHDERTLLVRHAVR